MRNRCAHSFDYIKTKLASLDFILGHSQFDYFEGEADKVQYFENRFQIRPQDLPGKTYRGANRVPDTIRYFVDKFPMFSGRTASARPRPTLTYIDPGIKVISLISRPTSKPTPGSSIRLPRFGFILRRGQARSSVLKPRMLEKRDGRNTNPKLVLTARLAISLCVQHGTPSDTGA